MSVSLIIYILSSLIILLIILLWVLARKNKKNIEAKVQKAVLPYQEQIRDLQEEVKRLKFIVDNCQTRKTDQELDLSKASEIDINELIAEKQRLEQEKQSLKEKTKKLWEQSLAIHREKDRIDQLRREIESRHKEITDSITYASRIQTALLPKDEQFAAIFPEYFVLWKPREIVSGDFYWLHRHDNRIFVVAADCTGHGVPGAFMSLLGISFLNEIINANPKLEAHQILEKLRSYVTTALGEQGEQDDPKDGMDIALVIIEPDKNHLEYAGANNPVYIIRQQQLIELKPVRAPIGYYLVHRDFEKRELELQEDDVIYMFSDGYADQFGGQGTKPMKFTRKRFKQLLLELNKEHIPMSEQKRILWETFKQWKGEHRQIDDVMVIGLRWKNQ